SATSRIQPRVEKRPALRTAAPTQLSCSAGPSFFTRTTDGGATWEKARAIVPTPVNAQTIGNQIVINPVSGALFDFFDFIDANGFHAQMVSATDQGLTWSAPQAVADIQSAAQTRLTGVVDPRTQEPVRSGDVIPEPAIDPQTGRLYLVWQDARFN